MNAGELKKVGHTLNIMNKHADKFVLDHYFALVYQPLFCRIKYFIFKLIYDKKVA